APTWSCLRARGVWAPQADRAPRRNLTPTRERRGRAPPTAAQSLRQPGGAGTRGKGCWSSSRTSGEERTSYSARLMSARSEGVWGRGRHQEWRVTRSSYLAKAPTTSPLARNPCVLYDLLLRTAWETVSELASDPRYLGATVGLLAVLHPWGQTLCHRPQVQGVVTGGGRACAVNGRAAAPARLAGVPAGVLPAGAPAQPAVSRQVPGRAAGRSATAAARACWSMRSWPRRSAARARPP